MGGVGFFALPGTYPGLFGKNSCRNPAATRETTIKIEKIHNRKDRARLNRLNSPSVSKMVLCPGKRSLNLETSSFNLVASDGEKSAVSATAARHATKKPVRMRVWSMKIPKLFASGNTEAIMSAITTNLRKELINFET